MSLTRIVQYVHRPTGISGPCHTVNGIDSCSAKCENFAAATMKITALWHAVTCKLAVYRRFSEVSTNFYHSSTPKTEAVRSSNTTENVYQTTLRHIREDNNFLYLSNFSLLIMRRWKTGPKVEACGEQRVTLQHYPSIYLEELIKFTKT